ncbi:hypothetical protein HDU98_002444 [Podochytrium sp. JEL0797]|nr:hypothetical protein HDU98_002444 [Podochytrium sp. JEL0797]
MEPNTDALVLLRHDMTSRNPYSPENQHAHNVPPPPNHSHPRTAVITELAAPKDPYPPTKIVDRNQRRYENTRGTLGGNVNFDGTNRDKPMISMEHYALAKQQRSSLAASNPELIYFGGNASFKEQQKRSDFRHRQGITIYSSDSAVNVERKKIIQLEMEKIQMEEQDWPFGKHLGHGADHLTFNHVVPLRYEEIISRQYEKNLSQQYAKELDKQIADSQRFKQQSKQVEPKRDDDQIWMFHHNHMNGRRPKVPFEPPRDTTTDLISSAPLAHKAPGVMSKLDPTAKKLRPPLADERKDVFPFNHDAELRQRREMEQSQRQQDHQMGKQFAESYPWKWGDHADPRKDAPHHKATDIIMQKEPINRTKALQYQADLNAMVQMKRESCMKSKQHETELWQKVGRSFCFAFMT